MICCQNKWMRKQQRHASEGLSLRAREGTFQTSRNAVSTQDVGSRREEAMLMEENGSLYINYLEQNWKHVRRRDDDLSDHATSGAIERRRQVKRGTCIRGVPLQLEILSASTLIRRRSEWE